MLSEYQPPLRLQNQVLSPSFLLSFSSFPNLHTLYPLPRQSLKSFQVFNSCLNIVYLTPRSNLPQRNTRHLPLYTTNPLKSLDPKTAFQDVFQRQCLCPPPRQERSSGTTSLFPFFYLSHPNPLLTPHSPRRQLGTIFWAATSAAASQSSLQKRNGSATQRR
jgi:hypothetical protein